MEIRRWHYYVMFNCVLIKYLEAKTISLNEVITAESQQKEAFETSLLPKSAGTVKNASQEDAAVTAAENTRTGKRHSLINRLRSTSRIKNFLKSGFLLDHTPIGWNKISPLKYKKTFLIKSPLKPRKLKLIQKSRYKRKNQSTKREINGNEKLKQKYIPLLKSLSMLFDNLLNSDASESYEVKTKKFKRNRFYSGETFEIPHNYTHESDSGITQSMSQEKTITFAPTITFQTSFVTETPIAEATSTTANITAISDFSAFRQYKNIPVLFPRNTFSSQRDDNGIGERSGATFHGNIKGNITRHHGDHEYAAGCGTNAPCTEDDEKNTYGDTRDGTRSFRLSRPTGNRNYTGVIPEENRNAIEKYSKNETTDDATRKNQLETRRNETKSARILQESIRRLRGFTSEDVKQNTEFVQSKEVYKESVVNVSHNIASYKQFSDRGSTTATEDQKVRKGNETVILLDNLNLTSTQSKSPNKKTPVVMIFDGYSVARHKNGENKFSEKSVHIHS